MHPQENQIRNADPFYYGKRMVVHFDPQGQPHWEEHPLTQHDFLNPREGDRFVEGPQHEQDRHAARRLLQQHYQNDPTTAVLSNLKMAWGIPRLPEPCPDIIVIPNLQDKQRPRRIFDVSKEQTRPCLIVEIISPRYRHLDLHDKLAIYARAGIPDYFIIDAQLPELDTDTPATYLILGYQLTDGHYLPIAPDERGRLFSPTTNLWFGSTPSRTRFTIQSEQASDIDSSDFG